ncbi:hypothetical protein Si064_01519 [Streptococcus infantarius subsp. infantarius]|nr:hypothetical protein [Streptococcus infantarius subsp. infantarius]
MKTNGIPKIRFKGFTDDWEQRKLSELYNKNTEKNEELISYDKTISIATMTYKNGGNGASDKSLKAYKVLRVGDLAFEGHTNKKFKYGRFVLNDIGTGIMSPRFSTLRPIQCMPISFWKYYIHYEPIMQKILVNSTKAGTMMNELVIPEFLKQSILVPSMNEQQKIGEYFSNLDRLITLHQRKCEQTKELKKFMLQKMFPKKGEKNPEIRFPGFTDDWEQRKLGEVGTARSGVGFPDVEQGGVEGIPFFKVSDMNIEGNENELVIANNYVTTEQISRKKWNVINDVPAIFFAKVGAAVMLNRKRLVRFPFLLDNNTMAYVFNKNVWNCDFGKTLFETLDLTKLTQVGALPSYNASDVENIHINIPNKDEQQKIGEYFSNLDHLITLHQRKCEQLKELKKFMLQNMFPKKG